MAQSTGKLAELLFVRKFIRLGDVAISTGTGAPSGATHAREQTVALYLRDDGTASTTLYATDDTGTTWRRVTFS